jgi:hypothetical protein
MLFLMLLAILCFFLYSIEENYILEVFFMKKLVAIAVALFTMVASVSAYEWKDCWQNYGGGIKENQFIVNVGAGINSNMFKGYTSVFPPIEVSVEYTKKIWVLPFGFGGFFAYDGYLDKWTQNYVEYAVAENNLYFGGLIKYHAQLPVENLDVYARTYLGAKVNMWESVNNVEDKKSEPPKTYFYSEWGLGATWYFSDFFGVNVELGYPTIVKAGVSLKF